MFRPPKYFANSFLCSVHDDNSQLEVRRYGKCFYITMAPENFVDSPPIKKQYLDYLAAERSDATDDDNMAEDYNIVSCETASDLSSPTSADNLHTISDNTSPPCHPVRRASLSVS